MDVGSGTNVTPTIRLVSPLGEGGMGSVWVARHEALQCNVAVKFIDAELIEKVPELRTRFRREASAAANINSPHVVRIFDHGEMPDGTPYIVMELLEGESLAERIARAGPLTLLEAATLVTQAAKALHKAHKLGIVHRDIKPDNLFLVDSGLAEAPGAPVLDDLFVKVLDFGVAKHHLGGKGGVTTMVSTVIGTPAYMSPEQILCAKNVDHRTDLWALAVVLYEAITNALPFRGETLGSLWHAITSTPCRPPSELLTVTGRAPGDYREIDEWFGRALAKRPENRFGSAAEMAMAFGRALPAVDETFERAETDRPPLPWRDSTPEQLDSEMGRSVPTPANGPRGTFASVASSGDSAGQQTGARHERSRLWMVGGTLAVLAIGAGSVWLLAGRPTGDAPAASPSMAVRRANTADSSTSRMLAADAATISTGTASSTKAIGPGGATAPSAMPVPATTGGTTPAPSAATRYPASGTPAATVSTPTARTTTASLPREL